MNPLVAQLTHRPFPEVAEIIRTGADQITREWDVAVRQAMPQMRHLTFDELKDSTPQILTAIAQALASDDPDLIRELVSRAPLQGLSRFRLNFDVVEVMQEDRLLRAITVLHVEARLGRRMEIPEWRDHVDGGNLRRSRRLLSGGHQRNHRNGKETQSNRCFHGRQIVLSSG